MTDFVKDLTVLEFYYKLVTTSHGEAEAEPIETLVEEGDAEPKVPEGESLAPRTDVKRRSTRRIHRHHSLKRGMIAYLLFLTLIIKIQPCHFIDLTIIDQYNTSKPQCKIS